MVVGALILLQWGLFRQHALREVVWAYPPYHDQVSYLRLAYMTHERLLDEGLAKGLTWGFMAQQPNGAMLHVQAALLFLLVGPSRLAALSLNFVYFALLQLVLVWTLLWLTRRWSLALLGMGLLLAASTPFHYAGGFMDFRIDFIAWCLYGTFMCLVIRSGLFVSRAFSLAAGCVAGLLALFRVITIPYLGGVFLIVAVLLAWRRYRSRGEPELGGHVAAQLRGLAWAAIIFVACSAAVIGSRFSALRAYYVVGHLTGSEKHIRAAEQGIYSLSDHLLFYPASFLRHHAGRSFVALAVLILVVAVALALVRGRRHDPAARGPLDIVGTYVFLGACFLVPLVVLTVNVAKSPVVADILVGPALWLVLWTLAVATRAGRLTPSLSARRTLQILGCSALIAGLHNQLSHLAVHGPLYKQRPDVLQILELFDTIGDHSRVMGWTSPLISVDRVEDFLAAPLLDPLMYERKGLSMVGRMGLSASIFSVSESQALDMARQSDFLILSVGNAGARSPYPFNQAMEAIRPRLRQFADDNLMPLGRFPIYGRDRLLYIRPALVLTGDSGGWITSDGFTLTGPGDVFRGWPKIELRGGTDFGRLPRMPVITAELSSGQRASVVPAAVSKAEYAYCILLEVDPQLVDPSAPATLRVTFDTYFIPKDDPRKLVIRTPTSQILRRADDGESDCRLGGSPPG